MKKTPVIFIGHGSPMNAIEHNQYSKTWRDIGSTLEKPRAILIFSAHWTTYNETRISTQDNPAMIYDMIGFPQELYNVNYSAPGSPEISDEILACILSSYDVDRGDILPGKNEQDFSIPLSLHSKGQGQQKGQKIILDPYRGLDHGVWSVLIHMFPQHDIPVICMSLDYNMSPAGLYCLGQSIAKLRDNGILIMGSGNIVHNLSAIDWNNSDPYSWAIDFDNRIAAGLISGKNSPEWNNILEFKTWGDISRYAHPNYDHLLPLFPLMGATSSHDSVEFFTPDIAMRSLSMRSIKWG